VIGTRIRRNCVPTFSILCACNHKLLLGFYPVETCRKRGFGGTRFTRCSRIACKWMAPHSFRGRAPHEDRFRFVQIFTPYQSAKATGAKILYDSAVVDFRQPWPYHHHWLGPGEGRLRVGSKLSARGTIPASVPWGAFQDAQPPEFQFAIDHIRQGDSVRAQADL
jgi:hypothetical protein